MIEPINERKVRDLNEKHVTELEKEFIETPQVFSVLIGHVIRPDATLESIQKEGYPYIEILGGNHTRQALQNLSKRNKSIQRVCIDVYKDLSTTEAIMLGVQHNAKHEHSRHTTFEDLVKLFRRLHKDCQSKEVLPKKRAALWRQEIANIMGMEGERAKNSFKTHMHVAAVDESLWKVLEDFFQSWRLNKISGKPRGDMKQTHIQPWTLCDKTIRQQLLRDVTDGNITFPKFKENCLKGYVSLQCMLYNIS
ncbi:hypothetical protein FSP39_017051 [Pinctada imbricata]|uniref:Uncharacterized protein n=1 Tax=Pinctada imbricata TaxID=66713 RepID=A0AA88Y8R8_PINIB|nr:hypothetical protein FSP39_017051 [Pinctada imbricata]